MPIMLERVSHAYGSGSLVLDTVDLEIRDGERVALTGPSGSGKTTLLSVLGLLVQPQRGRVLIDGVAVPSTERLRHKLRSDLFAWVPQTVNLLGRRSAVENVAIPLLSRGLSRANAHEVARSALASVGLGDHSESSVRTLSGGEVQRVCIARALVHRPRFLLADEPTGQLDHETSVAVVGTLKRLLDATGSSLVVATHDNMVASACERELNLVMGQTITS